MGPCESSLRLMASVDGTHECGFGGGGIREEELSPGEASGGKCKGCKGA